MWKILFHTKKNHRNSNEIINFHFSTFFFKNFTILSYKTKFSHKKCYSKTQKCKDLKKIENKNTNQIEFNKTILKFNFRTKISTKN